MKYLYVGLLILVLLLGACWLSARELEGRTQAVSAPLKLARQALQAGDGTIAAAYVEQAAALWAQQEGLLAGLLSHSYTNELSWELAQARALEGRELERTLILLLARLRALAEMEQPLWRNIF